MKKILLIFLCVFAFASVHADITWELSDDGTLTISGTNMPDYSHSEAPWFSQLIKKVEIKNGVTNIGDGAFDDQYCLTSITIPNSVTSIGKFAFSGCSGLTSINIPNSVTSIGDYVFDHCYSLTSITVEKGNTKYDSRDNCNAIIETSTNTLIVGCKNTIIPNSVTSIASKAFCGSGLTSITIPNSVTNIGDYAFSGCNFLTSISLPNSVTSIGIAAFGECSSLASITIPNSVNSIGITAFYGCESLTSITIPNSVTSIGSGAFERCSNLTSVTNLSATPQSISYYTFSKYGTLHVLPGCIEAYQKAEYWKNFTIIEDAGLLNNKIYYTSDDGKIINPYKTDVFGANIVSNTYTNGQGIITFDGEVTSIGEKAFMSCSFLTSITIPNSVTSIGNSAIYNCNRLTSITIPNSVTSIGYDAFNACTGLTSIVVDVRNTNYDSRDNCNAIIETSTNTLLWSCKNTVIPNSVTSIGNYAFYNCYDLTSITIPNSVTNIGVGAFMSCPGLTSITIPNSVTNIGEGAFMSCPGLTSITIPNSVTSIRERTFYGCSGLTLVTIPNSVTSIGRNAFSGCSNLTSITIPNSVTSIGEYVFSDCLTSVTNLSTTPQSVFYNTFSKYGTLHVLPECKEAYQNANYWKNFTIVEDAGLLNNKIYYTSSDGNIVNPRKTDVFGSNIVSNTYTNGQGIITFDGDIKNIGDYAFYGCSILTSISIPNSVISIGNDAFLGCSKLTSVAIPNSVTSIGSSAFYGCSGLTSISIPNSVTSIGDEAFSYCSGLTSITVEKGNSRYDSRNNCNAIIETSTNTLITGCMNSIIHNSVTSIGYGAFHGCSGLTSISIPNSVTSFGDNAFNYCSGLTSVTIPNSVTNIGNYIFFGCSNLISITIPNSVTSIGDEAFSYCSFRSISIPNSVTSIGDAAFFGCPILTSITIPNSVTNIGNSAFLCCYCLTSVTNLSSTPQQIRNNIVSKYGTLHVLPGCKEAYENAEYWKNFTIVEDAVDPFTTIVLVDGETYSEGTTQENKNINYTRTFNNTSWQALYIPFSMSYEDWKDDFDVAFINSVRQYDNDEDGIVDETIMDIMKIKSGSLIPNTPYLIKAKSVGEKTITINNATLYQAEENNIECSTMLAKYTFTGTYSTISASTMSANNYYAMGGGSLIMTDGTSDLKPFRWYLNIESRSPMYSVSSAAKTITINVVGEEEATGISQMSSDREPSSAIYDLNGRKMSQKTLKPGLYIKNGKKVIIK